MSTILAIIFALLLFPFMGIIAFFLELIFWIFLLLIFWGKDGLIVIGVLFGIVLLSGFFIEPD